MYCPNIQDDDKIMKAFGKVTKKQDTSDGLILKDDSGANLFVLKRRT